MTPAAIAKRLAAIEAQIAPLVAPSDLPPWLEFAADAEVDELEEIYRADEDEDGSTSEVDQLRVLEIHAASLRRMLIAAQPPAPPKAPDAALF